MMKFASLVLIILLGAISAWAQGKGVDKTAERVRDSGAASSNSPKTDTGAGRGFDFGKGRTPEIPPVPNPYRFVARRECCELIMRGRVPGIEPQRLAKFRLGFLGALLSEFAHPETRMGFGGIRFQSQDFAKLRFGFGIFLLVE